MLKEEKYVKQVLITKIPGERPYCSIYCPWIKTQAIGPSYISCYLFGNLENIKHRALRHEKCLTCPTLEINPLAIKNIKEIEETILVFADKLEELGAIEISNTFKRLLEILKKRTVLY